ncbi:CAMK/CAMKL/KIN1 protein kinase [Edhazardia aedis USNM 41457]|uniref:CAMK/CAMKL/KIN1 protein kinase n=1 Tax=Edhazardia aedis (strain USNM 41457) TaxID=1003232 RepID=J9DNL9_EDHAE|nr:CAMK/CAMKL/KIN1 protein kinase [Edhazardia aedis USNM 41457]|eukprot:EJW04130.1 CAMK/CAMKL/KIN1 protein kinase [Edhazardia aedis USNM 41457]
MTDDTANTSPKKMDSATFQVKAEIEKFMGNKRDVDRIEVDDIFPLIKNLDISDKKNQEKCDTIGLRRIDQIDKNFLCDSIVTKQAYLEIFAKKNFCSNILNSEKIHNSDKSENFFGLNLSDKQKMKDRKDSEKIHLNNDSKSEQETEAKQSNGNVKSIENQKMQSTNYLSKLRESIQAKKIEKHTDDSIFESGVLISKKEISKKGKNLCSEKKNPDIKEVKNVCDASEKNVVFKEKNILEIADQTNKLENYDTDLVDLISCDNKNNGFVQKKTSAENIINHEEKCDLHFLSSRKKLKSEIDLMKNEVKKVFSDNLYTNICIPLTNKNNVRKDLLCNYIDSKYKTISSFDMSINSKEITDVFLRSSEQKTEEKNSKKCKETLKHIHGDLKSSMDRSTFKNSISVRKCIENTKISDENILTEHISNIKKSQKKLNKKIPLFLLTNFAKKLTIPAMVCGNDVFEPNSLGFENFSAANYISMSDGLDYDETLVQIGQKDKKIFDYNHNFRKYFSGSSISENGIDKFNDQLDGTDIISYKAGKKPFNEKINLEKNIENKNISFSDKKYECDNTNDRTNDAQRSRDDESAATCNGNTNYSHNNSDNFNRNLLNSTRSNFSEGNNSSNLRRKHHILKKPFDKSHSSVEDEESSKKYKHEKMVADKLNVNNSQIARFSTSENSDATCSGEYNEKNILGVESAYINEENFQKTKMLGNFLVEKALGSGASASVKQGVCTKTGEIVAVKIVKREISQKETEAARKKREDRIYREVIISSLLCHPHIARLKNFYYNENFFYLVFEYIRGSQLLDVVISRKILKEKDARRYFRQILSAISYVHSNNIVHRDLKIENIIVDDQDNIKILDFGLSNFYDTRRFMKTFCGSLYFAAPELLCGKEYIGPEVDVWSLGVILYVFLLGNVPFDDKEPAALHAKIKKGKFKFTRPISEDAKNLVKSMICVDPTKRYSLQKVIESKWVNATYSTKIDNFLSPRKPLHYVHSGLVTTLSKVFESQFPNMPSEIAKGIVTNEGVEKPTIEMLWSDNPCLSLYYLLLENFSLTGNEDWISHKNTDIRAFIEELSSISNKPDQRAIVLHCFVNFLFVKERRNIFSKYFFGSVFEKQYQPKKLKSENENQKKIEKIVRVLSESDNQDLNWNSKKPKIKTSIFKGFFKGIFFNKIKTPCELRRILEHHCSDKNIFYDAHERHYVCTYGIDNSYCLFKISLYVNKLFNVFFLSITRLSGNKNVFEKIIEDFKTLSSNFK